MPSSLQLYMAWLSTVSSWLTDQRDGLHADVVEARAHDHADGSKRTLGEHELV